MLVFKFLNKHSFPRCAFFTLNCAFAKKISCYRIKIMKVKHVTYHIYNMICHVFDFHSFDPVKAKNHFVEKNVCSRI